MKTYKTQEEIDADIKDGELSIDGDVKFEVSFKIYARLRVARDIKARDIDAGDIDAGDIDAGNIKARDIKAGDINAGDIDAGNITAWNIKAGNIAAGNIDAWDIKAVNIAAGDISFFAIAVAYVSFKCKSIVARRKNGKYFCLDGEVEITG